MSKPWTAGAFSLSVAELAEVAGFPVPPSYLWVDSSNIINHGTLSVGANGWLKIVGSDVDLARGALEVTAIQPTGSFNGQTNFINDVGISDIYWGQTNTYSFFSPGVYNGRTAVAPPHQVQFGPGGPLFSTSFAVPQPLVYGYSNATDLVRLTLTNIDGSTTNILFPTNIVKQAVFVGVRDPAVLSSVVTFFPSSTFTNPFQTVCVRLGLRSTNVISGQPDLTTLFFYDTLASETNRGLLVNVFGTAPPPYVTERPANYNLSRVDDGRFAAGSPGNITPDAAFLYDPLTFSNNVVIGEYAGYAAQIDNLVSEPPPLTPGTVTNFPGRVQVYADTLDFRSTRVRGEGEVIVKANHLLSSSGAAVDCQNLSYTLGSTNGNLDVANLAKVSVTRLKGNLLAWSAVWTNFMTVILTNNYTVTNTFDSNGVAIATNSVPAPLTNTVVVDLYSLVLNGDNLLTTLPVITWELVTHSTNITISDSLTLVQSLLLDGQSFTLNGNLALSSTTLQNTIGQSSVTSLLDWIYTNAPSLLFFTNNGTLSVPSEAHFGDDGPIPYLDFVNRGTLNGGSVSINSSYVGNSGLLSATVGPLDVKGAAGKFQNGQSTSRGDINFKFGGLKFNNHQLSAVGAINFTVTNGLSDAGPSSANVFRAQNGFKLLAPPGSGDLLGTTFQSQLPNFVAADHAWAAQDRGVSTAGYTDNTALGKLILTVQSTTSAQFPLFRFKGVGATNGFYVDLLDLTGLSTNYVAMLEIDPGLTLYYASAKLSFTPPLNAAGLPQQPEEYLDGQFGGRLRWVSTFAGPNSSVDVVINGVTVPVNRALRFSKIIDSNGNGIPNYYDPDPFAAIPLVLAASLAPPSQPVSSAVAVSWDALTQKVYQVEFTSDIRHPAWQPLLQSTNTAATSSTVKIWDTNVPAGAQRFYRVKTTP